MDCVYDLNRAKTRYDALATKHNELVRSDADLHGFLDALRSRSDREASDILQRLRSESDTSAIVNQIKDGELLLQATQRLPDGFNAGADTTPFDTDVANDSSGSIHEGLEARLPSHQRSVQSDSTIRHDAGHKYRFLRHEVNKTQTTSSHQYVPSPDKGSAQDRALKRRRLDAEYSNHVWNSLHSRISTGSDAEAARIFHELRSGRNPSTVLRSLQSHDLESSLRLNSPTARRHIVMHSLVQSTASLAEIMDFVKVSGLDVAGSALPMQGSFEPLKNRTIDLTMVQRALQDKPQRRLEGLDKQARASDLFSNASARESHQENHPHILPVPAQPWTRLTTDDAFVTRLISNFLTFHNVWLKNVEEEPFLEAMRSRNLDTEFCSPLLVNAMCAYAGVSLTLIS